MKIKSKRCNFGIKMPKNIIKKMFNNIRYILSKKYRDNVKNSFLEIMDRYNKMFEGMSEVIKSESAKHHNQL